MFDPKVSKWLLSLGDKLIDWTALLEAGGQPNDKEVLELGPGFAIDAMIMARSAKRWFAVDIDPIVLKHTQDHAPTIKTKQVDLSKSFPFPDASFDLVLDFSTLDNCGNPEFGYKEACRVLRREGHLVTTFANLSAFDDVREVPGEIRHSYSEIEKDMLEKFGMQIKWRGSLTAHRGSIVARKL